MKTSEHMGKVAKLGVAAAIVTVAVNSPLFACSCELDLTTAELFNDATIIFEGTVVATDHQYAKSAWLTVRSLVSKIGLGNRPANADYALATTRYTFHVERMWKGAPSSQLILTSESGNCSYTFDDGQAYLVFAYLGGQYLSTNICAGTQELPADETMLKDLRSMAGDVPN